jgi:hypothetical protein
MAFSTDHVALSHCFEQAFVVWQHRHKTRGMRNIIGSNLLLGEPP